MIRQERRARHLGASVFVLVCALMVMAVPANAAGSGPATAGGSARPTLTFDPATVSVGDTYTVEGVGFPPTTWVPVAAYFSNQTPTWDLDVLTDGSGNLTASFLATESGRVRHVAETPDSNGRLRKSAQATLVVDPALQ